MGAYGFVKGSERLVDPITVGSVHFLQQALGMLPRAVQRRAVERASASAPYMGFVVEPYALFLFYEVADGRRTSGLLPEGFKLARAAVFDGDGDAAYAIVSLFRIHASTFWGSRAEFYLVAEDEGTGLLSWVMIDYLSDTVGYDRANGLRAPSAPGAVVTTSADGHVVADLADAQGKRAVVLDAALAGSVPRPLDGRLWVEGNLSVAYGPGLSPDGPGTFALTFPRGEMAEALDVPVANLDLGRMEWHADLLAGVPSRIACFPYAQHLLSDSPGASSGYASAAELDEAVAKVDFGKIPKFSADSVRKGMAAGAVASCAAGAAAVALAVALARCRRGRRDRPR